MTIKAGIKPTTPSAVGRRLYHCTDCSIIKTEHKQRTSQFHIIIIGFDLIIFSHRVLSTAQEVENKRYQQHKDQHPNDNTGDCSTTKFVVFLCWAGWRCVWWCLYIHRQRRTICCQRCIINGDV